MINGQKTNLSGVFAAPLTLDTPAGDRLTHGDASSSSITGSKCSAHGAGVVHRVPNIHPRVDASDYQIEWVTEEPEATVDDA